MTTFRVEHPFHPLFGRELELVERRLCFGHDHLYYRGDGGRLRSVPAEWSDQIEPDWFSTVSAGRSQFRPADLLTLADFIDVLRGAAGPGQAREAEDAL